MSLRIETGPANRRQRGHGPEWFISRIVVAGLGRVGKPTCLNPLGTPDRVYQRAIFVTLRTNSRSGSKRLAAISLGPSEITGTETSAAP